MFEKLALIGVLLIVLVGCSQPESSLRNDNKTKSNSSPLAKHKTDQQLRKEVSAVPDGVDEIRNVEFAWMGDVTLMLDLYVPQPHDASRPLLIWIHGGGWSKGSRYWCPLVWMCQHDYAVASIQYRLTNVGTFPDQIHDCKGAIRWLRAHAAEYGIDPDRFGVAGISAGGQLAALVGTSGQVKSLEGDVGGNLDQSSRVQAVLDMCGTSDFLLIIEDYPDYAMIRDSNLALLFGGPLTEKRDLAKLASSFHHVTQDDPPLLIVHGEKDPIVPLKQSRRLRDRYLQLKLDATLEVISDGEHVPREFWDVERRRLALKFFDQHLKAKGGN